MMVRVLIEVVTDDRATAEKRVADLVLAAVKSIAVRTWIAVDHPQPEHAWQLWAKIQKNEDPNRPGHAAMYPTPSKPL